LGTLFLGLRKASTLGYLESRLRRLLLPNAQREIQHRNRSWHHELRHGIRTPRYCQSRSRDISNSAMGNRDRIFRGVYTALFSLPANRPGGRTDVQHHDRRMGSRSACEKKGGGIARTRRAFRQVVAVPSRGGSEYAIPSVAIGRNSCREEDITDPSIRASARIPTRRVGHEVRQCRSPF
jgi:hypothetical protein